MSRSSKLRRLLEFNEMRAETRRAQKGKAPRPISGEQCRIRKGPSRTKIVAGTQGCPSIPGAKTRSGRAMQERKQLFKLQEARAELKREGLCSSSVVTGMDIRNGIQRVQIVPDKVSGLAVQRVVSVAPRPSAWNNPADKPKFRRA